MRLLPKHYASALYELLSTTPESGWGKVVKPFLRTLARKGMNRSIPTILRLVDEIEHREKKVVKVEVKAAHDLSQSKIDEVVKKIFPHTVVDVHQIIEPALIGGITLDTSDQRYDVSITGTLHSLERSLAS